MTDHYGDIHNLSSCEINAWKKLGILYMYCTCTVGIINVYVYILFC